MRCVALLFFGTTRIMQITNDALGLVLRELEPEEIYRLRSVNRQWNRVGSQVLGYSEDCAIAVAERQLADLRKKERQLKRKISELYQKRAEQYVYNPKWQKYQVLNLIKEFNIHFGPTEGIVKESVILDGVSYGAYRCNYEHTEQCRTRTLLEGSNCYCPISKFKFEFKTNIVDLEGNIVPGHQGNGTKFSIEYSDTLGWTGIDPELTIKDFDPNTKCARVGVKYNPSGRWFGLVTHIIEHIVQRVINYRIAMRRQMSKLIIRSDPEEAEEIEESQLLVHII